MWVARVLKRSDDKRKPTCQKLQAVSNEKLPGILFEIGGICLAIGRHISTSVTGFRVLGIFSSRSIRQEFQRVHSDHSLLRVKLWIQVQGLVEILLS